ncbi:hypothetical protein CRYUN_Cryun24cG0069500 [Craigia yunnanensis]
MACETTKEAWDKFKGGSSTEATKPKRCKSSIIEGSGRTILHGEAKYRATGRGLVVRHEKFAENNRMYSRSHFVKGLELLELRILVGRRAAAPVAHWVYGTFGGNCSCSALLPLPVWNCISSKHDQEEQIRYTAEHYGLWSVLAGHSCSDDCFKDSVNG